MDIVFDTLYSDGERGVRLEFTPAEWRRIVTLCEHIHQTPESMIRQQLLPLIGAESQTVERVRR